MILISQLIQSTDLLSRESVTVIGLLLTACGLLIRDKIRQEDRYKYLLDKYENEQIENKKVLIELVTKSILSTEQNTQAINNIKDVLNK